MLNTLFQGSIFIYGILAILLASDFVLLRNYLKLKKNRKDYEKEALKRAQKIINKAIVRGSEIVTSSQVLGEDVRRKITESSTNLSDQQKDIYQKMMNQIKSELTQVVQNASEDIKRDAEEEVSTFANSIREETISTEEEVKTKISAEYIKLESELAEYRKQRMLVAQKEVEELVNAVTQKVLGKVLSQEDQKELILKSLEEARNKNVF